MQDIWANSGLGQFGTLPERKPPRVVPARGWVTLSVATPPGRSRADQLESFEVGTRQRIRLTKKKRKPLRIVLTLRHGAFSTRGTHRFQDRTGQISRVRAFIQPNRTGDNASLDTVETQTPLRDLLEIGLLMGFHKFCIFIALLGDAPSRRAPFCRKRYPSGSRNSLWLFVHNRFLIWRRQIRYSLPPLKGSVRISKKDTSLENRHYSV